MSGLIIFLHGLNGDKSTWENVPVLVHQSLGAAFNIATPEYSAKVYSTSKVEKSARQIRTFLDTHHPNADPIILVGYSLGGLIARELCRQLLVEGDDALLNKIPAAITFGTPLEGAKWGNLVLRNLPFLNKLSDIGNSQRAFTAYKSAINASLDRKIRRPKLLHLEMEDDGVIADHIKSHYTTDDKLAGCIPGGHRRFATKSEDAARIADVLLKEIRTVLNAASRPNIRREPLEQPVQLPDRLILLACSHGKLTGGTTPFAGPVPGGWLTEGPRQRMISRRAYVYSLIKDAKLEDGFERGGNRAYQPANKALKFGPDLGGTSIENADPAYLPAHERYNGRIYAQITPDAWTSALQSKSRFRVLIMSGLYGLIEPDEQIQNYDVHLTDTDSNGVSVSAMWSERFTEYLQSYISQSYRNQKVKIFNFLCDHHYVDAVQWHALSKDCSVYHFASPTLEDVSLLPPAGLVINSLLLNPNKLETLERDEISYQLSDFGEPQQGLAGTEILFESRVGLSKKAI